jgi:hypothetical protein
VKVHPLVGWLIGLGFAALAFSTVGVWFLFNMSYAVMHGGFGGSAVVFLGSWIVVLAACAGLAYLVKKAVTRRS